MTKAKTVKEHIEESDRVTDIVKNANALVAKLQAELAVSRNTLESLLDYQHPKLRMDVPYPIRTTRDDGKATPASVIHVQTQRINALLGDKV